MRIREFIEGEEGIGTVEMVLILVIIVGLVVIFRNNIKTIVDNAIQEINTKSKSVSISETK